MTLFELFDVFLDKKQIALCMPSRTAADTLRVSLIRKFADYKKQMGDLGFLEAELENAVVSLEWAEETGTATYFLRPKKRRSIEYTLLESPDA